MTESRLKRCIALLTLLNLATPALALNIRVGADAGCDTNSLAAALAQAKTHTGADTIRAAANQAYTAQPLYIDSGVFLRGGALALSAGGVAVLSHSLILDNAAANGPALVMRGNSSQLRLLGSVVARNAGTQGECAPLRVDGGGSVRVNYTTFAGNASTRIGNPLL